MKTKGLAGMRTAGLRKIAADAAAFPCSLLCRQTVKQKIFETKRGINHVK